MFEISRIHTTLEILLLAVDGNQKLLSRPDAFSGL